MRHRLLFAVLWIAPSAAYADTISVTTEADAIAIDGDCSLREAITVANTNTGTADCPRVTATGIDTVVLPAGMFEVSGAEDDDANVSGDLDVLESVRIVGAGAGATSVTGTSADLYQLHVEGPPGTSLELSALRFEGLQDGGGVFVRNGDVDVQDVELENFVQGIFEMEAGYEVNVARSVISTWGGSYAVWSYTAVVVDSDIRGMLSAAYSLDVNGSLVQCGQYANADGPTYGATAILVHVTSSTIAGCGYGASGEDGAVASSTLVNNGSPVLGLVVHSSILGARLAGYSGCPYPGSANNLLEDLGECLGDVGFAGSLGLSGLADHGGPTGTFAIAPWSDAIGHGTCVDAYGEPLLVDQRGEPRPATGCDIGAFELPEVGVPGGALIDVTDEPAGANCAEGGVRVDAGVDDDGDGVLDPGEIDTTEYVCDGTAGTDGTDGTDGTAGTDGTDGTDGTAGTDGMDGADGGGCSTGGGGSAWLALAIALGLARRRRLYSA